jgi:dTDP-4-dehydrorhamnose reductase
MQNNSEEIFITGGTGLLGHYLVKSAPKKYNVSCSFFPANKRDSINYNCSKYHLDIRDRDVVLKTIKKNKPACVIHTASITSVDYVEKNREEAMINNLGGTNNIIEACQEVNARMIYTSSNAVFDGENPPYSENDSVNPLNYYGQIKVKGEEALRNSGLKYAIVRPILMYGWNLKVERKNPVTWLIDLLKTGKDVNIVDDIICNPLLAQDCADVIWKIVTLNREGVFHIGGEDEMSRYEFACITAEVFGLDRNVIRPVRNSFFTGIAPRPKNTTYCTDKIKKELQMFPMGVREGLRAMKETQHENA